MNARGTASLVELLVSLTLATLCLITAGAVLRMVATDTAARQATLGRERDHTAIWGVVTEQLRGAAQSEVQLPASTAMEYRRAVGEAPSCRVSGSSVTIPRDEWRGERLPDPARDRALVHDGLATGGWQARGIVSVSVANCPAGMPGLEITLGAPISTAALVRIDESSRLRHYLSAGQGWVGLESLSGGGVIQPLAGPIPQAAFHTQPSPGLVRLDLWSGTPHAATVVAPLEVPQ